MPTDRSARIIKGWIVTYVRDHVGSDMETASLKRALKSSEPILREYVSFLEKENRKLASSVARIEASNLTLRNRMVSLNKAVSRLSKIEPIKVVIKSFSDHQVSK